MLYHWIRVRTRKHGGSNAFISKLFEKIYNSFKLALKLSKTFSRGIHKNLVVITLSGDRIVWDFFCFLLLHKNVVFAANILPAAFTCHKNILTHFSFEVWTKYLNGCWICRRLLKCRNIHYFTQIQSWFVYICIKLILRIS